ncbi:MAG: TMEM175 family protein [Steroidobacteraceae bacterium]
MGKNRLEAFSDGVLSIIITIMVLEMKVPHGAGLEAMMPLAPVLMSYVLSFVYIGIYWNNHHHMLHTVTQVTGGILWANLHLLFWLSLLPFVTGWMGENHFGAVPTALYGGVLLAAAIAYWVLQQSIIASQGERSPLKAAIGGDWKGKLSPVMYLVGILATVRWTWIAQGLYVLVALLWLVPDRRIERSLGRSHGE